MSPPVDFSVLGDDYDFGASPDVEPDEEGVVSPIEAPPTPGGVDFSVLGEDYDFSTPASLDMTPVPYDEHSIQLTQSNRQWDNNELLKKTLEAVVSQPDSRVGITKHQQATGVPFAVVEKYYPELERAALLSVDPESFRMNHPELYNTIIRNPYLADTVLREKTVTLTSEFMKNALSPERMAALALFPVMPLALAAVDIMQTRETLKKVDAAKDAPPVLEERQLGAATSVVGRYTEALSKGMLSTGLSPALNALAELPVREAFLLNPPLGMTMWYGDRLADLGVGDWRSTVAMPGGDLATLGNKAQGIDAEVYALEKALSAKFLNKPSRAIAEARVDELRDKKFALDRSISNLQIRAAPVTWGEGPAEALVLESLGAVTSQGTSLAGMGTGALVGAGLGSFFGPGGTVIGAKAGGLAAGFVTTFMLERGPSWLDMRQAVDENGDGLDLEEAATWNNFASAVKALIETGMDAMVVLRGFGPIGDIFVKREVGAANKALMASRNPTAVMKDIIKRYAKVVAGEGTEEAAQQGVDIVAQIGAGAKAPTFRHAYDEILHAGLIGAIAGGIVGGASVPVHIATQMIEWSKVKRAGAVAVGVQELSTVEGVQQAPAEFSKFLTHMSKDLGRPIEGIFLNPLRMQEVVKESGGTLSEIVTSLLGSEGMNTFTEAINKAKLAPDGATKATLRIDTETFLKEWANTGLMQGFSGDITTASDTLTLREEAQNRIAERENLRETIAEIEKADAEAGGYVPKTDAEAALLRAVETSFTDVTSGIEEFSGEEGGKKIDAVMTHYRALARTQAERSNYTQEDLMRYFTIQFETANPAVDAAVIEQNLINTRATIEEISANPAGREEQLTAAQNELRSLEARKAAGEAGELARITTEILDPAEIAKGVLSDESQDIAERAADVLANLDGPTTDSESSHASLEQVREQAHNLAQWDARVRAYMANNKYTDEQIEQHIADNRTAMALAYSLSENTELEFMRDQLPHTQRDAIQQAWAPEFLAIYDANGRDIATTEAAIKAMPNIEVAALVKEQEKFLKAQKKALPKGKAAKQTDVVTRKAQINARLKELGAEYPELDESKQKGRLLNTLKIIKKEQGVPWPVELDAIHTAAKGDPASMLALINDVEDATLRGQMFAAMADVQETGSEKKLFATQKDSKTGEQVPVKAQATGSFRKNSDDIYRFTMDLSAMCRRRLEAAATVALIEKRLGEKLVAQGKDPRPLHSDELLALANLFRLSGKVAPCIICYVEAPRAKVGLDLDNALSVTFAKQEMPASWAPGTKELAQAAIDEAKAMGLDSKKMPSTTYWTDPEAAKDEALRKSWYEMPRIYDFMRNVVLNTKQNTPKTYAEYSGQLLNIPQEFFDDMAKHAGVRMFSTSDFQFEHVIDLMQAFHDLALRQAESHSYTKVPEFPEIFGDTNQKIQTSLFTMVPAIIVERNGSFDVELRGADGETTGNVLHTASSHEDAMEFLDEYTPEGGFLPDEYQGMSWKKAAKYRAMFGGKETGNVGTVLVTTSRAQIRWALENDAIDFLIPFHASGMKSEYFKQYGYVNFTSTQAELWLDTKANKGKPPKVRMHELGAMEGITNAEMTKRYLRICNERGILPAFSEFAYYATVEQGTKGDVKDKWVVTGNSGIVLFTGNTQTEAWQYLYTRDDLVNHNFAKLKKDYARSDTPFKPIRSVKEDGTPAINHKAADKVLRSYFDFAKQPASRPDYPSYTPDPKLGDQLMRLIEERENGGADPLTATNALLNNTSAKPSEKLKLLEEETAQIVLGDIREQSEPSESLQDAAARAMPNTKVVDENGKPKRVFHGTATDFTEFKAEKATLDGTDGLPGGFHFTDRAKTGYGDKTMEVFLKMDNPMVVTSSARLSGDILMSDAIAKGHDGVIIKWGDGTTQYVVPKATQIKSATDNTGAFDPTNPDIRAQGARGYVVPIRKGFKKVFKIFLRENADVSTPLHEMSHVYLTMLRDLNDLPPPAIESRELRGKMVYEIVDQFTGKPIATFFDANEADVFLEQYAAGLRNNVPQQVKHDYNAVLAFMGAATWADVTEAMEEKYARGFEKYLLEGNAPSVALISTFGRIKSWLFKIYRGGKDLDAEIDDTLRGVFDRMLATDDEISLMRQSMGIDLPFFPSAKAAGMTKAQFDKYQLNRETQVARSALHAHRLAMTAQKDALSKRWREELKKNLDQARANFDLRADVRAEKFVRRGELKFEDGAEYTGKVQANGKLDRAAVRSIVKTGSKIELSLRRATVVEGGIHPDELAPMFGFRDAADVLSAITSVPNRAKATREEADALTAEQFPEMKAELAKLEEKVGKALHMEGTTDALLREWRMINTKAGRGSTQQLAIEQHAKNLVSKMGINKLRPADALAKELKYAEQSIAAAAKGEFNKAADLKMQQLINHFAYREMLEAKEERDVGVRMAKKLSKDKARARLGKAGATAMDPRSPYLDVVDAILEGLEFADPRVREHARMAPSELATRISEDGGTVGFDPAVIDRFIQKPQPFAQLTVEEARVLFAALKNISVNAKNKNTAKFNNKRIAHEEAIDMLLAEADENMPTLGELPSTNAAEDTVDWLLHHGRSWSAVLLRQTTMLNWLGGLDTNSAWHQLILRPLREAEKMKAKLTRTVGAPIVDAFEDIPTEVRAQLYDRIDGAKLFPGHQAGSIKAPTRRFELMVMALNIGTQGVKDEQGVSDGTGNFERLLEGRKITETQVMRALSLLTLAEWQWVQSVWDASAALWPLARDLETRDSGLEPGQLPLRAVSIVTSDGHTFTSEGGYVPIVYDRRNASNQAITLGRDGTTGSMMDSTYARPGTSRGYLKSRVKNWAEVVSLEPGHFKRGILQVTHDVAFREAIRQSASLLLDPKIQMKMKEKLGVERTESFVDWLRSLGNNGVSTDQPSPPLLTKLRSNMMIGVMGWRVRTAFGDFANGFAALPKIGQRFWLDGYKQYFLQGKDSRKEWVDRAAKYSTWLTTAKNTLDTDFANVTGKMTRSTKPWSRAGHAFIDSAWWSFEQTFKLTAYPMWIGSVQKHLAEGMDMQAAAYAADDFCVKYFPAHTNVEKSGIQRDRGKLGFAMIFFGYMNSVYQVDADAAQEIQKIWMDNDGFGQKTWNTAKALPAVAGHLLAFWFASMVLGELLTGRGPEQDEKDSVEGWLTWAMRKELQGIFGVIPFLGRTIESMMAGRPTGGARGTPGIEGLNDFLKLLQSDALWSGDEHAFIRLLRTAGMVRGIPIAPLDQVEYVLDDLTKDIEQGDVFGLLSGAFYGKQKPWSPTNIFSQFAED